MTVEEIPICKVDDDAINILQNLLDDAKAGKIASFAFVGCRNNGDGFNCFTGNYYPIAMIGELRILERDLMDTCVNLRKNVSWDCCND